MAAHAQTVISWFSETVRHGNRCGVILLNSCCSFSIKLPKKVSGFWSPRVLSQTRTSAFLVFCFCFCYERMSNCSQNCWIDWNSAVLFHTPMYMGMGLSYPPYFVYGKFGLCVSTCSSNNCVHVYMITYFTCWQKKQDYKKRGNASPHQPTCMTRNPKNIWPNICLWREPYLVHANTKDLMYCIWFWDVIFGYIYIWLFTGRTL